MLSANDNSIKAAEYVMSYIAMNGGNTFADIDWEHKPKGLPEDVSRAWDVVVEANAKDAELARKGIEQ